MSKNDDNGVWVDDNGVGGGVGGDGGGGVGGG